MSNEYTTNQGLCQKNRHNYTSAILIC